MNTTYYQPDISMHILHSIFYCYPYISKEADKENFFHNQELL